MDATLGSGPSGVHPRESALDPSECIERLESTPIGRLGFVVDGAPLVLPVNFAYVEGAIVFRSVEGQKLDAAAQGQPVCFEVDRWDERTHTGWSVVVRGTAREVTDWSEKELLENVGLTPWAKEEWRGRWVRVEATEITGRLLR